MALSVRDLKALLGKHQNYLTQNGEINTPLLYRYAQECNTDLLTLLSTNDDARNEFFIRHGEHIIFLRDRFIDYIHHKDFLENSYTAYKNKVGLAGLARYGDLSLLKSMHEVVLSFPFKDCVLEGGQNKDEAKRNERYYNRVLAANEIDRLLDPKVLTNAQRYTEHGQQPLTEFTRDANINKQRGSSADTITDNLIIKGNNLLALHTLREQFAHKVKLIYIDPPYNTGNDSFHYNDSFNHSTWLVFMKNRLEAARELLRQDGVIFVQCDDNEQAYLKVLMDEVFGRENFVSCIVWRKRGDPPSNKKIGNTTEHILMYGSVTKLNLRKRGEDTGNFSNPDNDSRGEWRYEKLFISNKGGRETQSMVYPIINPIDGQEHYPPVNNRWAISKEKAKQYLQEGKIVFGKTRPVRKKFKSELKEGITWTNLWTTDTHGKFPMNRDGNNEIVQLFSKEIFENPKPEGLLQRILEVATKPGDIVLDYHLGSGTTAAVAHKMGRQYIGIEQMDYIESVSVARLQKVIEGEQGGISKAANWKGGGNFVYCVS